MTKRKDEAPGFLEEAERIEREEIQVEDEEAEGRWVFVRPRPAKEPSQVYSVRLPATVVEELRILASAKGEAPTALIRDWVLERLDDEIDRLPSTRPSQSGGKGGTRRAGTTSAKKTTARSKRSGGRRKRAGSSKRSETRRSRSRSS